MPEVECQWPGTGGINPEGRTTGSGTLHNGCLWHFSGGWSSGFLLCLLSSLHHSYTHVAHDLFPEILEGIFSTEEEWQLYAKVFRDIGTWIVPTYNLHQGTSF